MANTPRKRKAIKSVADGKLQDSYVFTSTHEFKWETKHPVPIGEIADSLLALERVVSLCPKVLEGLTSVDIAGIEVYVEKIESGSLIEDVIVRLIFKDKESFDAFIDKVGETVRKPGMPRNLLIGAVITALVSYGAWLAAKVSNPPGQTTITANNNVIINIGAGEVSMTPEEFKTIVEAAVGNKKDLAKNAVRLFNPARADGQAGIVIDGNNDLSFSPEVIASTPRTVEVDKQKSAEFLRDVDLQIRAMDRDSGTRGWACLIPGKIDRRIRLKLDEGIRPADIAGKFSVRADVYVYYRLDKSTKKMIPDHVKLQDLIEE